MASTITALTTGTGGVITAGDASGVLQLKTNNGTTALTLGTDQSATFAGTVTGTTISGSTGTLYPLTSGTVQNTTSGTSFDFTGIPSWAKRVTVMFNGVSTNGTSLVQIQVGSGSIINTGYLSYAGVAGGTTRASLTSGFVFNDGTATTNQIRYGTMMLTNITGNIWISSLQGSFFETSTGFGLVGGGTSPTLAGALDRVRVTTVNGTDVFDAGAVNILYE